MGRRALMQGGVTEWRALRRFFGLTLLLSWGVGGAYLLLRLALPELPELGGSSVFFVMACAPSLAALVCAAREGSLRQLIKGLVRPFNPIWLVVAFAFLPLLALVIVVGATVVGAAWPVRGNDVLVSLPLLLFATCQIVANAGPLGEELGWRGYALPRLLSLTTPLRASLVLGGVWCFWHAPAFLMGGVMAAGAPGFFWWCLATLALTVVMTWLYLRANGNVIVAGIVPHFVINGAGALEIWTARPVEASALAGLALAIVFGGLRHGRRQVDV